MFKFFHKGAHLQRPVKTQQSKLHKALIPNFKRCIDPLQKRKGLQFYLKKSMPIQTKSRFLRKKNILHDTLLLQKIFNNGLLQNSMKSHAWGDVLKIHFRGSPTSFKYCQIRAGLKELRYKLLNFNFELLVFQFLFTVIFKN